MVLGSFPGEDCPNSADLERAGRGLAVPADRPTVADDCRVNANSRPNAQAVVPVRALLAVIITTALVVPATTLAISTTVALTGTGAVTLPAAAIAMPGRSVNGCRHGLCPADRGAPPDYDDAGYRAEDCRVTLRLTA